MTSLSNPPDVSLSGLRPSLGEMTEHYLDLVRSFAVKDVRMRYVGSLMGFFWTVVHPLLELLTYTFVFTVILQVRFEDHYSMGSNALFLFCGMVPWLTLSESLTRCTNVVRENSHLIRKVRFPPSVLCSYIVLSETFNQVIRFMLLFAAALIIGQGLTLHALIIIPVLFLQVMFTLGLSMFLATTQVFFKDTLHLLSPILMIWLFITPIFYPAHLFPKAFTPLLMLNPLAHLVGIYRELILNHRLPHWGSVVIFGTCAALIFVLGSFVFHRHSKRFADLV
jgi:ABC-type polysaccharide/polyol phosphate export permease